jgi:hypothetical protein
MLFVLGWLLLGGTAALARPGDDLHLTITLIRGEHSKDSSETTQKIAINGTAAGYDLTFSGRPNPSNKPEHRTVTLTNDEMKSLKKLVDQHRWESGIEKHEFKGPDTMNYFSITVTKGSGSKENSLVITGMPRHPMVRPDPSFRFADPLIAEVFRILREHDPEINYVSVVD